MKLAAPVALLLVVLGAVLWLDEPPRGADLVLVNSSEVFTLDPQRMSYMQDLRLAHVLYEGLVRWDLRDYSIVPAAAEALPEISPDRRTYTFRIRPDARWSNGDPLTAHDFVYSWRRAILPDTAADYSNLFFLIEGAKSFFDWRAAQTAAFAVDPWAADPADRPRAALALIRRLRSLLDGRALPDAVRQNMPDASDRDAVQREIMQLDAAAREMTPSSPAALPAVPRIRAWCRRLDDETPRRAEAGWMWERALDRFDRTVAITAVDDRTLRVTLARPTPYFLDLLCFGVFHPVHQPTVEGWTGDKADRVGRRRDRTPPPFDQRRWMSLDIRTGRVRQAHDWIRPGRHVGNGTHVLTAWRYKRDLRLERNPYYHDPARVQCDSILVLTIEDPNTAVLAYESGRIDWLIDVETEYKADMLAERTAYELRHAEEIARLRSNGYSLDEALAALPAPNSGERRNIHAIPAFGVDFFSFNCRPRLTDGRSNPFATSGVRRAFALAVNKKMIVEQVTRLKEPVMDTLIPPGSIAGYENPTGLPCDRARARVELENAGWSDRDGDGLVENASGDLFPVVEILYTTASSRYKWMSINLKSQWESALGVRVELRSTETKFYKEDIKRGDFMIARGRWYGDYGDPTTFLNLCYSTDGNNDRGFRSDRVDDLLDRAAMETDADARMALLHECEHIIVEEELPILPICQLVQLYMYEPDRLRGISHHPRLAQYLWQMHVQDETPGHQTIRTGAH
jgi:ABC-type oligopeptide transport system substrate-binding subunit